MVTERHKPYQSASMREGTMKRSINITLLFPSFETALNLGGKSLSDFISFLLFVYGTSLMFNQEQQPESRQPIIQCINVTIM